MLNSAEHEANNCWHVWAGKNCILGLTEPEKILISVYFFYTYEELQLRTQLSWAWKKCYNLGPRRQLLQMYFKVCQF